mmetsp:Transcript_5831/g.12742  ORF Transcript_5831/g.12742 Transcript_5831/m.12742 type:complete len:266 (-) Transcript_5831:3580-4377(-)
MLTVQEELNALLSLHCRHMTKECSQEPIIRLRGLAASGIERYFEGWPSRTAGGATIWEVLSPEELHVLLLRKQWHRWSAGCCKLHIKTGTAVGRNVLMIQPKFKAWLKRAANGRTTVVIAFKVMVLTESDGQLELPPNCAYGDAEQARSKAVAMEALQTMCERRYPLSPGLLALVGKAPGSRELAEATRLEQAREVRRAAPAATTASSSSVSTEGRQPTQPSTAKKPAAARTRRTRKPIEVSEEEWRTEDDEEETASSSPSLSEG